MIKKFSFQTSEDFNYAACLKFLERSDLEVLFYVENDRVYLPLEIEMHTFLIRFSGKEGRLEVEVLIGVLDPKSKQAIKKYLLEWLDINRDLSDFERMCNHDFLLKKINQKHRGLRLIGIPNLTEALSWAIIGQQINLTFAYTLKKRLVEQFGKKIIFQKKAYYIFPTASTISNLTENDLRPLQFSRSKINYLTGVAHAIAENEISKQQLSQLSYQNAKEWLLKYKGIGNWTADYVLMKCLRFPNAFPVSDVGLHNAIKKQLNLKHKPSLVEIENWSKSWQGWESYATFYLWHSLL